MILERKRTGTRRKKYQGKRGIVSVRTSRISGVWEKSIIESNPFREGRGKTFLDRQGGGTLVRLIGMDVSYYSEGGGGGGMGGSLRYGCKEMKDEVVGGAPREKENLSSWGG